MDFSFSILLSECALVGFFTTDYMMLAMYIQLLSLQHHILIPSIITSNSAVVIFVVQEENMHPYFTPFPILNHSGSI